MPNSIVDAIMRETDPLDADEPVGGAARKVVDSGLPALPAVESDGAFAGIFGERELMSALFPGYVGALGSAAVISRSIDDPIERRLDCRAEPIRKYLTTDHVAVGDEYSDTQLAEIFLHHRVLVIPITTEGRVRAVVTRGDFFRVLVEKLGV
ncbi:MAG: CBS domain-containing protein [bacterium]